jgi:hypothetical protein
LLQVVEGEMGVERTHHKPNQQLQAHLGGEGRR